MPTVSKEIADRVKAGNGHYPGDEHLPPVTRIVRYDNAWGGESYGLEYRGQEGTYRPTEFVRNPTVYWERSPKHT